MPIRYLKTHAALEGIVSVEDAEALAQWLQERKAAKVHLARCEHLHAAALQALLVWRPQMSANVADAPLARLLAQHLSFQPAQRAKAPRGEVQP